MELSTSFPQPDILSPMSLLSLWGKSPQTPVPAYISSKEETTKFLDRRAEVAEIVRYSKTPDAQLDLPYPTTCQQLIHSLLTPFILLQAFTLLVLESIGLQSKQNSVRSVHLLYDTLLPRMRLMHENRHVGPIRVRMIETARNIHRLDTAAYFTQPPIDLINPENPYLLNAGDNGFDGKTKKFRFFFPNGVCAGITGHFVDRYLHARRYIKDPKLLLKSVTQICKSGATEQMAFRQNYLSFPGLINRTVQVGFAKSPFSQFLSPGAHQISLFRIDHAAGKLIGHRIAFFKYSNKLSYLFDPNIGTLEIQSQQNCDHLKEYFTNTSFTDKTIYFIRKSIL